MMEKKIVRQYKYFACEHEGGLLKPTMHYMHPNKLRKFLRNRSDKPRLGDYVPMWYYFAVVSRTWQWDENSGFRNLSSEECRKKFKLLEESCTTK